MSTPDPDPASMSDHDLIFAMGVHDDVCVCAWCLEWHRRRGSEPAPAEDFDA